MVLQNLEGKTLGQYELVEFLGKGGMGVVYRARQAKLKRDVAVKILSPQRAMRPEQLKRFHREAEISAALEHPHIVPIYDFGSEDELNYVVMRLLTGGSLADTMAKWLSGKAPGLALDRVAEILKQVASALDYAHSKGVIHRDIKPSNVMFDDYGNTFLVDFGLVKLLDVNQSALTSTGMILGTPNYMAPEQWLELELTPAIDQYALGIIVYTLVTKELPFNSDKPYDLMQMHCNTMPPPAHEKQPVVPQEVTLVLNRALAKKAHERYPTVSEFAEAFQGAVTTHSTGSYSVAGALEVDSQMQTIRPVNVPQKPVGILRVEKSRDLSTIGKVVRIEKLPFEIGRLTRDLNFDNDKNVSRYHAMISQDQAGKFFIEDQGSTLHTLIDDIQIQPYTPVQLSHNDRICFGDTTMVVFTIEYPT